MDVYQFGDALPAINDISTIMAVGCVLPIYFLYLRPSICRWLLSLGILCGLATSAAAIMPAIFPSPQQHTRFWALFFVFAFSPLVLVLIAMLIGIKHVTRIRVWGTVVLACIVANWAGIYVLVLALS